MTQDEERTPSRGRRRLHERDRQADAGERPREYAAGEWDDPDDPLAAARAEAVDQSAVHRQDQPPPTRDVRKGTGRPIAQEAQARRASRARRDD